MVNEAVIVEKLGDEGDVIDLTVSGAIAIEKGTLCNLVDPRTTSGAGTFSHEIFGGIAAAEKETGDAAENIGVLKNVIANLTIHANSKAILTGEVVCMSGANFIRAYFEEGDLVSGQSVGRALQDGVGSDVIEVLTRGNL